MFNFLMSTIDSVLGFFAVTLPSWWRAALPKWFRFIFYYASGIIWVPTLVVLAFFGAIVGGVWSIIVDIHSHWEKFR